MSKRVYFFFLQICHYKKIEMSFYVYEMQDVPGISKQQGILEGFRALVKISLGIGCKHYGH